MVPIMGAIWKAFKPDSELGFQVVCKVTVVQLQCVQKGSCHFRFHCPNLQGHEARYSNLTLVGCTGPSSTVLEVTMMHH